MLNLEPFTLASSEFCSICGANTTHFLGRKVKLRSKKKKKKIGQNWPETQLMRVNDDGVTTPSKAPRESGDGGAAVGVPGGPRAAAAPRKHSRGPPPPRRSGPPAAEADAGLAFPPPAAHKHRPGRVTGAAAPVPAPPCVPGDGEGKALPVLRPPCGTRGLGRGKNETVRTQQPVLQPPRRGQDQGSSRLCSGCSGPVWQVFERLLCAETQMSWRKQRRRRLHVQGPPRGYRQPANTAVT